MWRGWIHFAHRTLVCIHLLNSYDHHDVQIVPQETEFLADEKRLDVNFSFRVAAAHLFLTPGKS